MNPTIARMALHWLRAEHQSQLAKDGVPDDVAERDMLHVYAEDRLRGAAKDEEIVIAADRVYQVMSGEVRWSECSPGDRAIWKGQFRDIGKFEQLWREDPAVERAVANFERQAEEQRRAEADPAYRPNYPGPEGRQGPLPQGAGTYEGDNVTPPRGQGQRRLLQGGRSRQWMNIYDTIKLSRDHALRHGMFFGAGAEQRIGNTWLTNLQVPGYFASDQTFVGLAYYVSLSSLDALRFAADNIHCAIWIGDKPQHGGPMFVRDLFMGVVPKRPLIIQVRQLFRVEVELRRPVPDDIEPFELAFHVDGLATRDTP